MIYTLTPNPALDIGGVVDEIVPDEKNYVREETRFPGGNAINAARMIHGFRIPVVAGGFLGGAMGEEIVSLLDGEKVRHDFLPIRGRTRMSVTVSNRQTHKQTRLSFPGPRIRPAETQAMFRWIKRIKTPAVLVIGGSLPAGFGVEELKRAMKLAHQRNIPVVVDVPGKYLKDAISAGPVLIKPNLTEFQDLVGKPVTSLDEVIAAARRLREQVPLLCISSVEGGAVFMAPCGIWYGRGPKVKAKSSVGAGDSMVGAMTALFWQRKIVSSEKKGGVDIDKLTYDNCLEIFRWGLSAAVATVITPGTELGTPAQMKRFHPKVLIRRIGD